jgi:hypothetical protein
MASKKQMQAQIEALTERLTYLENMHARLENVMEFPWGYTPLAERECVYEGKIGHYNGRGLTKSELRQVIGCPHPQTREHTATTSKLDHITLQELARFVIDKVPIKRVYHKSDRYEILHDPDSITKSVETDLGNIKITEGTE